MSVSFYYVITYNLHHPSVKKLLGDFISTNDSLVELRTRSKMYHDFIEVTEAAHHDFDLKMSRMYKGEQPLRCITAINPIYNPDLESDEMIMTGDWQDNCAGSIFFTEAEDDDDDELDENVNLDPALMMIKYEIFFVEDIIELPVNGDTIFSPVEAGLTTSTYH